MALELMKENKNNAAILNYAFKILLKKKMTISAKKYFINTIHHLVLLYPYLIFLLDKVFDEKDLITKSYIQKISLDIFNLGKEKRNYEAMSYAIYFALKYDFKLEAEINLLEEAGKKEDCILMLLCYLYDKKNGNNIQEYKTIANNFIIDQTSKKTIKILNDEYWLFAYEVLLREGKESLDTCEDWKQICKKEVSFIKKEFR